VVPVPVPLNGTDERLGVPPEAAAVFGDRLELACRFADLLATEGTLRGLLGPREAPRLWARHLLNCAVVSDLIPPEARVVDVGTGAGLPGVALAIRRPDLRVDLVEPLERRVSFLNEAVHDLQLAETVRVVHGRAQEPSVVARVGGARWVSARAVAPLGRLVGWCLPLLQDGGRLLALKGSSAVAELTEHQHVIRRCGGGDWEVVTCGVGVLTEPTAVVVIRRRNSGTASAVKETR
jgi:16S rRNA (guanine527-N7)-methyltransferase